MGHSRPDEAWRPPATQMRTQIGKFGDLASLLLLALTISGCSKPSPRGRSTFSVAYPGPPVSVIAEHYTNYVKVTPSEVLVNGDLAAMCRGVSPAEVEDAQKKYGPHANAAILIYMSRPAALAFRDGVIPYPVGAVIVKEKMIGSYTDSNGSFHSEKNGVGGMVKRAPGFDSAHGDWEYFYFEDPAKIESGTISSCVKCHESAKATDYVFGTWRSSHESAKLQ